MDETNREIMILINNFCIFGIRSKKKILSLFKLFSKIDG